MVKNRDSKVTIGKGIHTLNQAALHRHPEGEMNTFIRVALLDEGDNFLQHPLANCRLPEILVQGCGNAAATIVGNTRT